MNAAELALGRHAGEKPSGSRDESFGLPYGMPDLGGARSRTRMGDVGASAEALEFEMLIWALHVADQHSYREPDARPRDAGPGEDAAAAPASSAARGEG
jgi:hypothetical protein